MNILRRKKKEAESSSPAALSVSTREKVDYTVSVSQSEMALYKALRENVPLIDVGILKIRRLLGNFSIKCEDEETETLLRHFLSTVQVGASNFGADNFIGDYLESLLTYGSAVGEIALRGREIAALYNAPLNKVTVKEKRPLEPEFYVRKGFEEIKCPNPELILFTAMNPEPGEIYGVSLLRGLPFVSEVLMKIYKTIGVNWERIGNVRFAVSIKDGDSAFSEERAKNVAEEWQKAMKSTDVRDFISMGEVNIQAIGGDIKIPDSQIPVRQLMEQIIAKMGLPPFLLGLAWSSTERMSSQQADILTSEIDAYRRLVTPAIDRIVRLWMSLEGRTCDYSVEWSEITMQDEVDHAKARKLNADADMVLSKIEHGIF